ncbi:UAA transporter [Scheffersomyces coipomensis]|uniref:UAA transporter n=1 Tax=Scheffersomyces coipomensis TaxID=1788519 RepID=UPI00315DDD47
MVGAELTYITLSQWLIIVYQVFGGCCTNVFVLETLFKNNKSDYSLTTIITFSQFLFVSILSYFPNADFKQSNLRSLYLKPTQIPIKNWLVLVAMFFTTSILNNAVSKFNITIPVHIIFRSSGTVVTVLVGRMFGKKRYNRDQIISVVIISFGILIANLPLAISETSYHHFKVNYDFVIGLSILLSTSILGAFMGLYNELLFKKYGTYWQESLFYTHFLALPLFLFVSPIVIKEFNIIWYDKNYITPEIKISQQFINLLLNVGSQYFCITGVNILASKTTALTVTVVLVVRKFISLIMSVLWFGNELTISGLVGAMTVLSGALYYSYATNKKNKEDNIKLE